MGHGYPVPQDTANHKCMLGVIRRDWQCTYRCSRQEVRQDDDPPGLPARLGAEFTGSPGGWNGRTRCPSRNDACIIPVSEYERMQPARRLREPRSSKSSARCEAQKYGVRTVGLVGVFAYRRWNISRPWPFKLHSDALQIVAEPGYVWE